MDKGWLSWVLIRTITSDKTTSVAPGRRPGFAPENRLARQGDLAPLRARASSSRTRLKTPSARATPACTLRPYRRFTRRAHPAPAIAPRNEPSSRRVVVSSRPRKPPRAAVSRARVRARGRPIRLVRRVRTRVVPPLSSQESYDRTRSSMENYERARASRDALSETRRTRTPNREVIDGRGSIDSRAFNETHELVGYSIDDRGSSQGGG